MNRPLGFWLAFLGTVGMRSFRLTLRRQAHVTAERIQRFHSMGNKVGPIFAELLTYAKQFDWQKYGPDQAPMHDPTTVVGLLQPQLFSGREGYGLRWCEGVTRDVQGQAI